MGSNVWGLDRLDQRQRPLNNLYHYNNAGAGVHIYVIDSGINKDNTDFGGRAEYGPNYVTSEIPMHPNSDDCFGHGTQVAGLAAGAKYGVAKAATVVAVRIFDCNGVASNEDPILNAIIWVLDHGIRPAVINLSLGAACRDPETGQQTACPDGEAQAIVTAERAAIEEGIPVATSAGNAFPGQQPIDACGKPVGAAAGSINVGAINENASYSPSSNFGRCVTIWAPGTDLQTDTIGSPTAVTTASGTSFAAPYVTGAVAALLGTSRFAGVPRNQLTAAVSAQIDANATQDLITGLPDGSPNKLLYIPPTTEGSSVALAKTQPDGGLRAVGVNAAGNLVTTTQTQPNTPAWNIWKPSSNSGWSTAAADTNDDGRVLMMALTPSGWIYQRRQLKVGDPGFTGWSQIDGIFQSIAVTRNQNGVMEALGIDLEGVVFITSQTKAGDLSWNAWTPLVALPAFTSIAAETDSNGIIQAFAVDTHGQVWKTAQTAPNAGFGPFAPFTDPVNLLVSEVAVARDGAGNLNLIATDASNQVYQRSQSAAGEWTDWTVIGTAEIMHLAAETNANGAVAVLTVGAGGAISEMDQESPGSSRYRDFVPLDGLLRP